MAIMDRLVNRSVVNGDWNTQARLRPKNWLQLS
jgi:hypothetical protein